MRVDQDLLFGTRRSLQIEGADTGILVAEARLNDARRRLVHEVRLAYMQAVLATADQNVAKTSLEEIDRVIGLNRARFEQGAISGVEFRRLQVERLRFADDVFAAELASRNARSALLGPVEHAESRSAVRRGRTADTRGRRRHRGDGRLPGSRRP